MQPFDNAIDEPLPISAAADEPALPAPAPAAPQPEPPADESKARRPDFEEGRAIVLANGQAWHFRRPRVFFIPDDSPLGFRVGYSNGNEPETIALRKRLDELGPSPLIKDLVRAELALAKHGLRQNYDLTDGQVNELLHFAYPEMGDGDQDAVRIRDEVMAVLNGDDAPKAGDGGDA